MKYVVNDPGGPDTATYERVRGRWQVSESGPLYLAHDPESKAPTLIKAVLEGHRRHGRILSDE